MAWKCDATGEKLSRTASLPSSINFTACGWAMKAVDTTVYQNLFALENGTTNWIQLGWAGDSDTSAPNRFAIQKDNASPGTVASPFDPPLRTWFFWAIQRAASGGTITAYIRLLNQKRLTQWTATSSGALTPTAMTWGNNNFDEFLSGLVAGIKVWDAVLRPLEILRESYQLAPVRRDKLHLFVPGDRGLADLSGRSRTLTMGGSPHTEPNPPVPLFANQPVILDHVAASGLTQYTLAADPGSVVITGTAAQLEHATIIVAASGTYTISGTAATFKLNMPAGAGAYSITGTAATLLKKSVLAAAPGSVAITGTAASLLKKSVLVADSGSVAITGTAASLRKGVTLIAAPGSVVVTGTAATLLKKSVLAAAPGSVVITGSAAALKKAFRVVADPGSVVITGTAATLRQGKSLVAAAGAFAITGTAATLRPARRLMADPGSVTVSGTDAVLRLTMPAAPGVYVITGAAATFRLNMPAAPGMFTISGSAATLRATRKLTADPGSVLITGTPAALDLRVGKFIAADPGAFVISGSPTGLIARLKVQARRKRLEEQTRVNAQAYARANAQAGTRSNVQAHTRSPVPSNRRS